MSYTRINAMKKRKNFIKLKVQKDKIYKILITSLKTYFKNALSHFCQREILICLHFLSVYIIIFFNENKSADYLPK